MWRRPRPSAVQSGIVAIASLAFAFSLGCGPQLPPIVTKSKWVNYHHTAAEPPCADVLNRIDTFVDSFTQYFAIELPPGFRIDYFKFPGSQQAEVLSICLAESCTKVPARAIYTTNWANWHELTHAVMSVVGTPPGLFAEGLAQLFDCGPARWQGTVIDRTEMVENELQSDVPTWATMGFVRYLMDLYGKAAFKTFAASTPRNAATATILARFQSAFGDSLADVAAAWRISNTQREGGVCVFLADVCDQASASTLADGAQLPIQDKMDCLENAQVFDVEADLNATLSLSSDSSVASATISPCDDIQDVGRTIGYPAAFADSRSVAVPPSQYLNKRIELWTSIKSGKYSIVYGPLEEDQIAPPVGTLQLKLQVASTPISIQDDCASAPAVEIPDDLASVVYATSDPGAEARYALFSFASATVVENYLPSSFVGICSPGCPQSTDLFEGLLCPPVPAGGTTAKEEAIFYFVRDPTGVYSAKLAFQKQ